MPKRSQSSTVPPSIHAVATAVSEPLAPDTIRQTVLKVVETGLFRPTSTAPTLAPAIASAMQRLVDMIQALQARAQKRPHREQAASADTPTADSSANAFWTTEALMPYVSEEAYDVWEALQSQQEYDRISQNQDATPGDIHQPDAERLSGEEQPLPAAHNDESVTSISACGQQPISPMTAIVPRPCYSATSPTFITIDTLIPRLLWGVARSSYHVMHLVEGIRVQCKQPEQADWVAGMLRLTLILEAEAPTIRWQFDLATGDAPTGMLEPTALIQSDEAALPIKPVAPSKADDLPETLPCEVKNQLHAILEGLNRVPEVSVFLHGVTVDLLQPGGSWQTGTLRLRLGFEFIAQERDDRGTLAPAHLELLEAELIDETNDLRHGAVHFTATAIASVAAKPYVTWMESEPRSLSPATLVRITDAPTLARCTQLAIQQHCGTPLSRLQSQPQADHDVDDQLLAIVKTAITAIPDVTADSHMGLLQPMLLMDELVPKLLWWLTSSTYEIMQLLGGLPAQVLQPNATWQQGTLRLLALLQIKAIDQHFTIDLSTGQAVTATEIQLSPDAIVQSHAIEWWQQPIQLATLKANLDQQIRLAASSCELLQHPIAIEWLEETAIDWQPGTLQLSFAIALFPDAP